MRRKLLYFIALSLFLISSLTSQAQASEDQFKILPGDVLQISVWKEEGMDHELTVLPDGSVTFPLVGNVKLKGLTTTEATSTFKKKLKRTIPHASVSVIVKAPLGHTVNVIGQVNKPGTIVLSSKTTVMQALSQAGGLTPYADDDSINILRKIDDEELSIDFPYDDVSRGRKLEQNIYLEPGDVIVVSTEGLF